IELCWSYNRQHGTRSLAVMPTNLYGPGDNYHPTDSHVIPALIRRFHEAKERGDATVTIWGTGSPRREFLYSDDMAQACLHLLRLPEDAYGALLGDNGTDPERFAPPLVNIGSGEDLSIRELAELVKEVTGFAGGIVFDASKPDGAPQKLLDVSLLRGTGWRQHMSLEDGLRAAYADFLARKL
ncbi:MAG TPA: NAD-dependent epimerase/dehydratase family protein, partial [Humidesulfovibrio sp.]|uniref:NAD-dependent epimerase/dehydratase family protein n=1 Tax=Humidesulfovibrio sp. TaxID=2910988 RepID=UPI002CE9CC18